MRPTIHAAKLRPMLAALALLVPAASFGAATPRNPDRLVILSTTDVKGKTSPCGCHTPKGGLARQASFADSLRAEYENLLVVDNGGFFPEDSLHLDYAPFLLDQMKHLGVAVVGVGDRDLKYGASYLLAQQKRVGLPFVCANLLDKKSRKPLVATSHVQTIGGARVGFFGLISDKVDLGPSSDQLVVQDPLTTAKTMVAELKKKGATVIVLLSQLGKVESEDLATMVEGIDAVIAGRNVPLLQKGRLIKDTVICYGGEQGQYFGRTLFTLNAKGMATSRDCDTFMLGPEVGERPDVLTAVKAFEDAYNERQRELQKQNAERQGLADPHDAPVETGAEAAATTKKP
jgi:2',3'-cyclic-nucleotide 2'-phosphodiesterase (5'-nucleotidase family)